MIFRSLESALFCADLEFRQRGGTMENLLSFKLGKIEDFAEFIDALEKYHSDHISEMAGYLDLKTCLEELIVNIFHHGGYEGTKKVPDVEVRLYTENNQVIAEITDNANPFNPLDCGHIADTESALEDRPIGGLGIHLVKQLSDRLEYVPVDQGNKVILGKAI